MLPKIGFATRLFSLSCNYFHISVISRPDVYAFKQKRKRESRKRLPRLSSLNRLPISCPTEDRDLMCSRSQATPNKAFRVYTPRLLTRGFEVRIFREKVT